MGKAPTDSQIDEIKDAVKKSVDGLYKDENYRKLTPEAAEKKLLDVVQQDLKTLSDKNWAPKNGIFNPTFTFNPKNLGELRDKAANAITPDFHEQVMDKHPREPGAKEKELARKVTQNLTTVGHLSEVLGPITSGGVPGVSGAKSIV